MIRKWSSERTPADASVNSELSLGDPLPSWSQLFEHDVISGPFQRLTAALEHALNIHDLSDLEKLLRSPYTKTPTSLRSALQETSSAKKPNLWELFFNEMLVAIWEGLSHVNALSTLESYLTTSSQRSVAATRVDQEFDIAGLEQSPQLTRTRHNGMVRNRRGPETRNPHTSAPSVANAMLQQQEKEIDEYEAVILQFRASVSDECMSPSAGTGPEADAQWSRKERDLRQTQCAIQEQSGDTMHNGDTRFGEVARQLRESKIRDEANKLLWLRQQKEEDEKTRLSELSKQLQTIQELQDDPKLPPSTRGSGERDTSGVNQPESASARLQRQLVEPNLVCQKSTNPFADTIAPGDKEQRNPQARTSFRGQGQDSSSKSSTLQKSKLKQSKQAELVDASAGDSRLDASRFSLQIGQQRHSLANMHNDTMLQMRFSAMGVKDDSDTEDDDDVADSTSGAVLTSSNLRRLRHRHENQSEPNYPRSPSSSSSEGGGKGGSHQDEARRNSQVRLESNRSALMRLRQKQARAYPDDAKTQELPVHVPHLGNEMEGRLSEPVKRSQDPASEALKPKQNDHMDALRHLHEHDDEVLKGLQIAQRVLDADSTSEPQAPHILEVRANSSSDLQRQAQQSQPKQDAGVTYSPRTTFRHVIEDVLNMIDEGTDSTLKEAKLLLQRALEKAKMQGLPEELISNAFECQRKIVKVGVKNVLLSFRELDTGSIASLREVKKQLTDLMQDARAHSISEADLEVAETTRRKLHNSIEDLKGSIRVFCRMRPMSQKEIEQGDREVVRQLDTMTIEVERDSLRSFSRSRPEQESSNVELTRFEYDSVFCPGSQEGIFDECRDLVQSAFDGYSITIFAYGQTGAGKTYTMLGTANEPGLTPNFISNIYDIASEQSDRFKHKVTLSMVELYRNELVDLLQVSSLAPSQQSKRVAVRIDKDGTSRIENVLEQECANANELTELVEQGILCRRTGSTAMNAESSRSHLIKTIKIETTNLEMGHSFLGRMLLVDLAGSERLRKSAITGEAQKEAIEINRSLTSIGDVIEALAQGRASIPYREHKLTQILQESLGRSAKTLMFVHCSPANSNLEETLATLRYASRAKCIKRDVTEEPNVQARPSSMPPPLAHSTARSRQRALTPPRRVD